MNWKGKARRFRKCHNMTPKKRACPYRQAPNAYNSHKIGGFEMSRGRRRNGTNTMQCFSNAERRIGKQRLEEFKADAEPGYIPLKS